RVRAARGRSRIATRSRRAARVRSRVCRAVPDDGRAPKVLPSDAPVRRAARRHGDEAPRGLPPPVPLRDRPPTESCVSDLLHPTPPESPSAIRRASVVRRAARAAKPYLRYVVAVCGVTALAVAARHLDVHQIAASLRAMNPLYGIAAM